MPGVYMNRVFYFAYYGFLYYYTHMLNGIVIYTADNVWREILCDLNATIADSAAVADLDFDSMDVPAALNPIELKSLLLNAADAARKNIINNVFGKDVALSDLQMRIVSLLYNSGGVSAEQLKSRLGFAPNVATHAADTAIYNLRKIFGRDFIKLENGKYVL